MQKTPEENKLSRAFSSTQTAARKRFKGQAPRVLFLVDDFGDKFQGVVIHGQYKKVLARGPLMTNCLVLSPHSSGEAALKELKKNLLSEQKSGT